MASDPGWYPDPWRPGQRRWWDGNGWTDHTWDPSAPMTPTPAASQHFVVPPDPQRDLRDERSFALWARRGFVAFVVGREVQLVASVIVFNGIVDDIRRFFDTNGQVTPNNSNAWFSAVNLLCSSLSLLAFVAIVIWAYKAATVASNLHYPATRGPLWAIVGWIIPIVNFWFPYQAIRDCLPPHHAERRTVKLWWACFVLGLFISIPAIIVSAFGSLPVAFALVLPGLVVATMEVSLALRMVDAVEADHADAINQLTS